jgi:hypothetical protein
MGRKKTKPPCGRENCKFETPDIALRNFAIPNKDFAEIGLNTLSPWKTCP